MSDTIDGTWFVILLGAIVSALVLYWIIRLAVRGAIRDAAKGTTDARAQRRSEDGLGGYPAWNASTGGPVRDPEDAGDGPEER